VIVTKKSITFFSRLVVAAVTEASKQDASSSSTTANAVALWIIRGAAAADATLVLSQLLSRRTRRDTARPTISRSAAQFDHHLVAALVITNSYTSIAGLPVCFLGTSVVDLPHNLRILPSHFQFARSLPRQLQILQVSRPPGRFVTAGSARDHQS
jgi:hypothetical protein